MRSRVQRIFRGVPDDVDLVLLQNSNAHHVDMSFFYATELVTGGGFERSVAVLHRDGAMDLLVPLLEETSAKRANDVLALPAGADSNEYVAGTHQRANLTRENIVKLIVVAYRGQYRSVRR